jgi:hypothetical protein
MRILVLSFILCGVLVTSGSPQPGTGQWLLVTIPAFRTALAPLCEYRRSEGFDVVIVQTTDVLNPGQLREGNGAPLIARIRQLCGQHSGPNYVLLAGAVEPAGGASADQTVVPAGLGTIERMKGKLSDHVYGNPDSDGISTIAVGRFPAQSVEQVQAMVNKTLSLEQNIEPASWRDHMLLVVGNPGGGPIAEIFMQQVLASQLAQLHPCWTVQSIIDIPSSPYFLTGVQLRKTIRQSLEEGALFSVYLGHSDAAGLWSGNGYLMRRDDWMKLNLRSAQGIFFTCGCFACQWKGGKGDGYGVTAMRNPEGPAAVLGATGESYSAPGGLAAEGLLTCLGKPPFPTRLADYWLAVQSGLGRGKIDDATFALADAVDGSGGKVPLAVQRREHLEMWTLLGDPALRLPLVPFQIPLEVIGALTPGSQVTVNGSVPECLSSAIVQLSLERPLLTPPAGLEKLPENSPTNRDNREHAALRNFTKANTYVLTKAEAKPSESRFTCQLQVPRDVPWSKLVIKAYAVAGKQSGAGAVLLPVGAEHTLPVKTGKIEGRDARSPTTKQ